MIGAYLRRGIAAGLVAGVVAGVVGLAVAEPAVDKAIAIEQRASGDNAAPDAEVITRPQQKAGLVAGYALVGAAMGALFSLASVWAVGRVGGDAWSRSVKLGAVATAALVLLPTIKYPPNPPGVGDPATVGTRAVLYLALCGIGLLVAATAWAATRQFGLTSWGPLRQVLTGVGVVVVVAVVLAVLPSGSSATTSFPAELLWRFRLAAVATQVSLWVALAAGFGLLTARSERAAGGAAS